MRGTVLLMLFLPIRVFSPSCCFVFRSEPEQKKEIVYNGYGHKAMKKLLKLGLSELETAIILGEHGGEDAVRVGHLRFERNNPGNLRTTEYLKFNSLEQGLSAFTKIIRTKYVGMTISQMSKIYAPDDPKGWERNVLFWLNKIN